MAGVAVRLVRPTAEDWACRGDCRRALGSPRRPKLASARRGTRPRRAITISMAQPFSFYTCYHSSGVSGVFSAPYCKADLPELIYLRWYFVEVFSLAKKAVIFGTLAGRRRWRWLRNVA